MASRPDAPGHGFGKAEGKRDSLHDATHGPCRMPNPRHLADVVIAGRYVRRPAQFLPSGGVAPVPAITLFHEAKRRGVKCF